VIVADDGSQDTSIALATAWAVAQDFPARVLRNPDGPTGGPAHPLTLGLRETSAEYVATLDGDDLLAPTHLHRLAAMLDGQPGTSLVFGEAALFRENPAQSHGTFTAGKGLDRVPATRGPENTWRSSWERMEAAMLEHCFVPTCAYMMRRSALDAVGGLDLDVGHAWDYVLFLRLALHGGVAWTNEILGFRREHPLAMSAAGDLRSIWPPFLVLAKIWSERDALELTTSQRHQLAARIRRLVPDVLYCAADAGPRAFWRVWRATGRPKVSLRVHLRALRPGARAPQRPVSTPTYLSSLVSALTLPERRRRRVAVRHSLRAND
jgi:glycosyltransferase involved in cell wall biosynthesis